MVPRIQAGACQRHPSLVAIVCALRPGAADPGDARDLLPAARRSKSERTLAARCFAPTRPLRVELGERNAEPVAARPQLARVLVIIHQVQAGCDFRQCVLTSETPDSFGLLCLT